MKKEQKSWSLNEICNNPFKEKTLKFHYARPKQNKLMKINAKVKGQQLTNENYTEYQIEIITDYKTWYIYKRYSELSELNQNLTKTFPLLGAYFPPKRLLKNSKKTIEERVKYFNRYFHYIFSNVDIFLSDEVIDFINMNKDILGLFLQKHTMLKKNEENTPSLTSLKRSFHRISNKDRAKSMDGEFNFCTLSKNSKENLKEHFKNFGLKNYSEKAIIEKCILEDSYDIDDLDFANTNYFTSLFKYENSKHSSEESSKINETGKKVVENFLKYLSQDIDNKTEVVKSFEQSLKEEDNWKYLSTNEIIKLYIGIQSNDNTNNRTNAITEEINKINRNSLSSSSSSDIEEDIIMEEGKEKERHHNKKLTDLNGLFYHIGNYEGENYLLSITCLDLLVKLLDIQYNQQADIYVRVFKERKLADYQKLNLEGIIKNKIGGDKTVQNALKLLCILFSDKNKEQYKQFLLKDILVIRQFNTYYKNYFD